MRKSAKFAWAALAFVAFSMWDSRAEQAMSQVKNQCWTDFSLSSRPGEERIRKTPYNRAQEPKGELEVRQNIAPEMRGSIRRVQLPPGEKWIALTFDLCENGDEIAGYEGKIVDTLRALQVKATFFPSGKWLLDHRERAEQLMADPLFEVGGHSWTHLNFHMLNLQQVKNDLAIDLKADAAVRAGLTGKACYAQSAEARTRPLSQLTLFRFPFGTCTPEALKEVNDEGLLAIQWDVTSADSTFSAEAIHTEVMRTAKPGSIVVMHGNGRGKHTGEVLTRLVADLRAKGFQFATVSELLAKGTPVTADTCYELKPGDNLKYDKVFSVNDKTGQ